MRASVGSGFPTGFAAFALSFESNFAAVHNFLEKCSILALISFITPPT